MSKARSLLKPNRVELVDALRGFALLGIILIHSIEHYEIFNRVASASPILAVIDRAIWVGVRFLLGGKCYAIFALMFGFSFYVQYENRQKRNEPFAGRFFWRMCLLYLFGILHLVFYPGDILTSYALIGMLMIPLRNLNNRAMLVLMIVMALGPFELYQWIRGWFDPGYETIQYSNEYRKVIGIAMKEGETFWSVAKTNLTAGRINSLLFTWRSGRFFQTIALFLAGILLGRKGLFTPEKGKGSFWVKVLIGSVAAYILFYLLQQNVGHWELPAATLNASNVLLGLWINFVFTAFWVALFSLLWFYTRFARVEEKLVPFGQMSLTNYIASSAIGAVVFYNYGLGLYRTLGITWSLLFGVGVFLLLRAFSRWWLARYRRGPLETVWYRLATIRFGKP